MSIDDDEDDGAIKPADPVGSSGEDDRATSKGTDQKSDLEVVGDAGDEVNLAPARDSATPRRRRAASRAPDTERVQTAYILTVFAMVFTAFILLLLAGDLGAAMLAVIPFTFPLWQWVVVLPVAFALHLTGRKEAAARLLLLAGIVFLIAGGFCGLMILGS